MATQSRESILAAIRLGRRYDGPLVSYPLSVGDVAGPFGAAHFSWLIARPAVNVALQIDKIVISSTTAGLYTAQFLNQKLINALVMVLAAGTGGGLFVRLDAPQAVTFGRSGIFTGDSTGVPGLSGLGPIPWRDNLNGTVPMVIQPPTPFVMWGDDPSAPGLGVAYNPANTLIAATFHGREWPLDTSNY